MTMMDATSILPLDEPEGWEDWNPPVPDGETLADAGAVFRESVEAADRAQAEQMAEWLAGVQRRRAAVGAVIQPRIDALEVRLAALRDRAAEIDAPLARKAAYLEGWLGAYAVRERERSGGKTKSVKLLYATAATSERGGGWVVNDEEALPWFMANQPDLVETKPRVMVAEAKRIPGWRVVDGQVVTEGGETIPGVMVDGKTIHPKVTVVDDGPAL